MPIHSILLISGDEPLARHITTWLNGQPEYVLAGHCPTLESALDCRLTLNPTILVVDLDAPDAIESARWLELTHSYPHMPIVSLVTAITLDIARLRATHAGALRFVAKDGTASKFLLELEAAVQQEVEVAIEKMSKPFTGREREVLLLIAGGLSNHEIAQRLVVSEKTVKRHVSTIMQELEVGSRVKVALWAYEHGLTAGR